MEAERDTDGEKTHGYHREKSGENDPWEKGGKQREIFHAIGLGKDLIGMVPRTLKI